MRRAYLILAAGLALVAGGVYYAHTREVTVVVAARALSPGERIGAGDVRVTEVSPALVPRGAIGGVQDAVGRWVDTALPAGAIVVTSLIRSKPAAVLPSGVQLRAGYRVLSVPVTPASALGGAIHAGDLVDVFAVPSSAHLDTGASAPAGADQVGYALQVLGLRTDTGLPYDDQPAPGRAAVLSATTQRLGSVLLLVPQEEALKIAALEPDSQFVLALAPAPGR
jgi:Flp pilus assembly protein CpaB